MSEPGPSGWLLGLVALGVGALAVVGFLALESRDRAPATTPAVHDRAELRLAHRYLDADDPRAALEHYLRILDRDPHNPEALSHAGWIAFESGDVETGERLVRSSLDALPDGAEALWFLANIRLYGRDDPASALAPLEALRGRPDLSDEFRADVDELLQLAHARESSS